MAVEDTGSTARAVIAYLGAVPPVHLPATPAAIPMLSAATPQSAHIARSLRSDLLAERVAQLKQSVDPRSTKASQKGSGPRPSTTPTTAARRSTPPAGSAPPADSLFEGARHRYHTQLVQATVQHNQARVAGTSAARVAWPQARSGLDELGVHLELRELRATCERQQTTLRQHEATICRLHRIRYAEVEESHATQRHAQAAEVARVGSTHTVASLRAELVEARDECRRLRYMLGEAMYGPTQPHPQPHPQPCASPVSEHGPAQFLERMVETQHAEQMRTMLERFEAQGAAQAQQHTDNQAHMRLAIAQRTLRAELGSASGAF